MDNTNENVEPARLTPDSDQNGPEVQATTPLVADPAPKPKAKGKKKKKAKAKTKVVTSANNVEPARLAPDSEVVNTPESTEQEDYLRQYQYKKQAPFGSVKSDPQRGSKAEKMKQHLLSQPRVRFMIPLEKGEDKNIKASVNMNGYRLDFPKNAYVLMPEDVANLLMNSLNQTSAAIQSHRIDGDERKEAALS